MRSVPIITLLLCALALPASASARTVVGIGDQHASSYQDRAMHKLKLKTARLSLAWDWYKDPWAIAQTDAWVAAVRAARMRPLITFNRNWRPGDKRRIPKMRAYMRSFRMVRARYPRVRDFSPWNEPNAVEQPFYRKPARAARYFNALRRACRKCTVVAADINDGRNMVSWLSKYRRKVRHAKVWGLHNYKDATSRRTRGTTRTFLRMVRGKVWLTETGGLRSRGGLKGQARSVRRVFSFARSSRRIRRIYFYQWRAVTNRPWDSAFLTARGKRRPAYFALRAGLRRR
jgi:hypothetical protein